MVLDDSVFAGSTESKPQNDNCDKNQRKRKERKGS